MRRVQFNNCIPTPTNNVFALPCHKAFTGAVPFGDRFAPAAMTAIIGGKRPPRPTHPSFTDELWKLTEQCWDQDRRSRPRTMEVLLSLTPLVYERRSHSGSPPVIADVQTAIVSDIQRRLENLDPSNEEYRPLLYALLDHPDLKPHIDGLRKGDLQGSIEFLNKVGKNRHLPLLF